MESKNYDVILDCYTDEPSGYGAPPYLGIHQRYVSAALDYLRRKHFYLTIDDLRYAKGKKRKTLARTTDISTLNLTLNTEKALTLLKEAETIYIIMGCFVDYQYLSALPPRAPELYELLKEFKTQKKILFYVLGGKKEIPQEFFKTPLSSIVDKIVIGHTYNFLLKGGTDSFLPNYDLLAKITNRKLPILEQLKTPRIMEIETMTGCNWARCSFCIERVRHLPIAYRKVEDIIKEIVSLYKQGARYFRLGRNPNFYYYMKQDVSEIEALLYGIRSRCPDLKVLHIDNVSPQSVVTLEGQKITKLIVKYCTSGNIAPFGIESFDPLVRKINTLNGTIKQIMKAIEILNEYGKEKGENGQPKFLPGVNLIYGLPGQRPETLDYNLYYLEQILQKFETQRLFFRKLCSPFRVSMRQFSNKENEEYEIWKEKIYNDFAMLKKVFPEETILKNVRVEVWQQGDSVLRQLGTCPPRVVVKNKLLPIGKEYDIVVKGILKHRTLIGELV